MKKILLTSACLLAVTGAAFAQGKLAWNIITPAAMTAQTNSSTYSPLFGGGEAVVGGSVGSTAATPSGFYYELLYTSFTGSQAVQPTSLDALASWSDAGLSAVNGSAGRLSPVNAGTSVTVPWAAGTTQSVMLVGWSANLGTTWAQVLATLQNPELLAAVVGNAYFGMSNTGYIAAGGADPGSTVFATAPNAQGLPIYSLNTQLYLIPPVPEPTTIALAALGGASLLLFRRRK